MRFKRFRNAALAMSLLIAPATLAVLSMPNVARAQTNTTGAIDGAVSDSTGAIVPNATIAITNTATGAIFRVTSNASGEYRVSQLPPGSYTVSTTASGFQTSKLTIQVSAGQVATGNLTLSVGETATTVEVTGSDVPLLHTDDAQISTTFTQEQIENMPNPGNDLTFVAQTAPGSIMNTQGGYGNFSSFGLPGTANTFTVNGGYYNDPFLNINNSGASNLALGANDIASVSVTSNAYNASFGGLGGAQVTEVSRSGGNKFHGNADYWWNGRAMNANDFFNKNSGTPRPFDNVNQWAAAVGGPIKKDKSFFFANYEGLRVVLPSRATVYAPDASYQAQTLANLTANGLASEIPIYQNIFNLYNNAPGYANATQSTSDASSGGYGTVQFNANAGNFTHEYLFNGRVDQNLGDHDHLFGHATIDKGVQATYTNVLNPIFDALSPQPAYEGQLGEQHIFSPNVSNSFLFSTIYYRAVFTNTNENASAALVPFTLLFADGDLGSNSSAAQPGGDNYIWPQGRDVTGYQFQDDVSWTKGKHTIGFGWTMRRDDLTDFSPSEFTTSPEAYTTNASFQQGYVDLWYEQFPTRQTQPVALYDMGWYLQDQWKALPNLTITYGLRMEHNSDPVCRTSCFARLGTDFNSANTSTAAAYNTIISSGHETALAKLQPLGWEPRIGFAYLPFGPTSKTTLRAGFGMFADAFPGQVADMFLNNAPTNIPFTVYGPAFGGSNLALVPSAPGSARSAAAASAAAFQSGFASGASLDMLAATVPGFAPPNISTARQRISYPTYEEWSLSVEQQISKNDSISVQYVGNRSYHQPVLNNGVNAFNQGGAPGFGSLSTTAAPNSNFAAVTEVSSGAISNYNGGVAQWQHRARSLTLNLNYEYSHALDEISNGGFNGFSGNSTSPDNPFNLAQNYGNADYDVRHYISGNVVYTPHLRGPKLLVDNWTFSSTVFHSTGLPFSVTDSGTATALANYGGPLYAQQTGSLSGHTHCGGESATTTVNGNNVPCAFTSNFTSATDFGQSRRNQMFGPNYTDNDFAVFKGFGMPGFESGKLKIGAQFYNLWNHPNFGQPNGNIASGSFGLISTTVNPPTSILGSFLGGDASPRLVQITGKFEF
jgi:Carboxypeptidase regulatory-like domain